MLLCVFSAFSAIIIINSIGCPKKRRGAIPRAALGFWGGLMVQGFILDMHYWQALNFSHLAFLLLGLVAAVYAEHKGRGSLNYFICGLCAGVSAFPHITALCLIFSYLTGIEEEFLYKTKASGIFAPLMLALGLFAGFLLRPAPFGAVGYIMSLCGGSLIYMASGLVAPGEDERNTLSFLGAFAGFIFGFAFY